MADQENQWWQTDQQEETTKRSSPGADDYNTSAEDDPYIAPRGNEDDSGTGGGGTSSVGDDAGLSNTAPSSATDDSLDDAGGDDLSQGSEDPYNTNPDTPGEEDPYNTFPDAGSEDDAVADDENGLDSEDEDASTDELAEDEDGTNGSDDDELGGEGVEGYDTSDASLDADEGTPAIGLGASEAMDGEAPEEELGSEGLSGYDEDADDDSEADDISDNPSVDEAMDNDGADDELGADGLDGYDADDAASTSGEVAAADEAFDSDEADDVADEGLEEDGVEGDGTSESTSDEDSDIGGAGLTAEDIAGMDVVGAGIGAPSGDMSETGIFPELDESAYDDIPFDDSKEMDDALTETIGEGSGLGDETAVAIDFTQDIEDAKNDDGSIDKDKAGEAVTTAGKSLVKSFIISHIVPITLGIGAIVLGIGAIGNTITMSSTNALLTEEEEVAEGEGGGLLLDFSNHHLPDKVMAWAEDVQAALSKAGLSEDWLFIVLGMIHQESKGDAEATPDIMQASESMGWPRNTIDDPIYSIEVGVNALKDAVDSANAVGITDVRAILQGYNMGHAFLSWMDANNHPHWTLDIAMEYSRTVVFPSLSGGAHATDADRVGLSAPWAAQVGVPWRYNNGGDFHYPNAVMHVLGIDYTTDGPIELSDIGSAILAEGSLEGYQFPIPMDQMQITSDYGQRFSPTYHQWMLHAGIDAQYTGDLYHAEGPIYAAADGKVTSVSQTGGAGNTVVIVHGPPGDNDVGLDEDAPITTKYFHLAAPSSLRAGQSVKAGDVIGHEGKTGNVTGEHLHFEVHGAEGSFDPRHIYDLPVSLN